MFSNKFISFFNNYVLNKLPIIAFVLLTLLFVVNSLLNIGLLGENSLFFDNMLLDFTYDSENRHFETFISHFPVIVLILLGFNNVNALLIIHGFWLYFSTLVLFLSSYFLFPSKQKHLFLFVLLSFLLTMHIVAGHITSQTFISIGLYWLIIIPIIFEDFNTISTKKLLIMIIASFIMIKGYQLDAIFMVMFIIWGLKTFNKIKNNRKYYILTFVAINIFALFYNIYKYIFPLGNSYYKNKTFVLYNPIQSDYLFPLIILLLLLFVCIYLIIRNIKSKKENSILFFLFLTIFIYVIALNFIHSFEYYRMIGYFFAPVFSFIIYIVAKKNLTINIKYLAMLNFILLIAFIINMSSVSIQWNKKLNLMFSYLTQKEGFVEVEDFYKDNNINLKTDYFPPFNHLVSILIQKRHGVSLIKTVFVPIDYSFIIVDNPRIIFPDLTKYGIHYSKKFKFKYMKELYDVYNNEFLSFLN